MCRGIEGDAELERIQVWENDHWRLTMALGAEVLGFSYLEPKRHIPNIAELDGIEARTFGKVIAQVTKILRQETGAKLVYVYVFGDGIPHLHLHLAPHRDGDALNSQILKGEMIVTKLPSGAESLASKDFPPLPESEHREIAEKVKKRLASQR